MDDLWGDTIERAIEDAKKIVIYECAPMPDGSCACWKNIQLAGKQTDG